MAKKRELAAGSLSVQSIFRGSKGGVQGFASFVTDARIAVATVSGRAIAATSFTNFFARISIPYPSRSTQSRKS